MTIAQEIEKAKRQQQIGQQVEDLTKEGIPIGGEEQRVTEYEKATGLIVNKVHNPKTIHELNMHTIIQPNILTNLMMMGAIEHGLRKLTDSDTVLIDEKNKKVTIYHKAKLFDSTTKTENEVIVPYRTISLRAYRASKFYAEAMTGITGTLEEQLVSIDGKGREQAVQEVSSLTNSERMLLEAQNQQNAGMLKKIWKKVW